MRTIYGDSITDASFDITINERTGLALTVVSNEVIEKDGAPISTPAWFSYVSATSELADGSTLLTITYTIDTATITVGVYTIQVEVSNGTHTVSKTFDLDWSGTPTTFLPTDISALVFWASADRIIEESDGDAVGLWPANKLGTGWGNPTQLEIEQRPTYFANVANGLPALYFDTHADNMNVVSQDPIVANTVIMVIKPASPDTATNPDVNFDGNLFNRKFLFHWGRDTGGLQWTYKEITFVPVTFISDYFGNDLDYQGWGIQTRQQLGTAIKEAPIFNTGNPSIISRNFALSGQAGQIYVNGRLEASSNDNAGSLLDTNLTIGWGTGCYIFEVLVFDSVLSNSDRNLVENYLAVKYGIDEYVPNIDIELLGDTVSHYTAESISGGDLSGTDVITWQDTVGGFDLTAPTAGQRPERIAAGVNGLAYVEFDGVDEMLSGATTLPDKFTVVFVFQVVSSDRGTIIDGSDSGGTNKARLEYNASNQFVFTHGTSSATSTATAIEGTWSISVVHFNNGFSSTFFDDYIRLNEADLLTANVGSSDVNSLSLGAREDDTEHINVRVAEVIIYNNELSLTDIRTLEKHFQWKYNL